MFDRVPRKSARQLFKPIKPRGVDLAIKPSSHPAVGGEEAKQPANGGDLMLQTCTTHALPDLRDICLDIARLDCADRDMACFQMLEKAA